MKRHLVACVAYLAALSALALPTYEPFTEFAPQVAANPTNAIDLATGGYTAPSGESWSGLLFSGLATGTGQTAGPDVLVTTNGTLYTANSVIFPGNIVSSLLPPGFPGAPTNLIQNGGFLANAAAFIAYPGYIGYEGNAGTITDWTTSAGGQGINGAGVAAAVDSPFGPANQASGPYAYVFIQGTGNVSQNLSLAPSTAYTLSFLAAARSDESTDTFQVEIGDANGVGDIFNSGTNAANDTAFTAYSYTFTTPASFSGTPSIQLQNVTLPNTGKTVNFTDVSVAPASAPASIPIFVVNPSQPAPTGSPSASQVGNSAVLNFAQDITRPASGTKTVYVSYLFSVAQKGQLGAGNDGRYFAFLSATNLVEPSTAYPYWSSLFNTYGTGADPRYCGYGLLDISATEAYIGACDSSAGKDFSTSSADLYFGAPELVVGCYTFTSASGVADTNSIWVNPSASAFGGATPPVSPNYNDVMAFQMSDIGGICFIDRVGSGGLGGIGTNYVANLLIGSTWSYVTGGPEFTNQPAGTFSGLGGSATISAAATAAGQTVTYQWERIQDGSTNPVSNGLGGAGGSATVSGATTTNLTLTGIQSGDYGIYEVVATASSTGFSLASAPAILGSDPVISVDPQPVQVNYGGVATFSVTSETKAPTLSYVWYDNGTALTNGLQADGSTALNAQGTVTNSGPSGTVISLTMSNVSYLDDGNYSVEITNNAGGSAISTSATLGVIDPYIVAQPTPASQIVAAGNTATISVVAAGSDLTYQWYGNNQGQLANNSTFSGATNATLTISNIQDAQADGYFVIVTGASGSQLQSSNATLLIGDTNAGPFSASDWPGSLVTGTGVQVDYCILDPNASFNTPNNWNNTLSLPGGGDQTYISQIALDGLYGDEMNNSSGYINVADQNYTYWANVPVIDILMQVYGDSDIYSANPITALEGEVTPVNTLAQFNVGVPLGLDNGQWNWVLLEVTNPIDSDNSSVRTVGAPAGSGTGEYSGVNNGTIRLQSCNGWAVRAIAWGPKGVFGTSNQVNVFAAPGACAPEPNNNLAYIDYNQRLTNNLEVISNASLGYGYTTQSGVGPAGDLRTAIQSTGSVMNFGITSNYLGYPCSQPLTMELGIEFYDDPNLTGTTIAPNQYATDEQGDLATYSGLSYTTLGTGKWLKLGFTIPSVDLEGVSTAPLTGGPTLQLSQALWIDRVELGVYQIGTNALAGLTPDPAYQMDPLVGQTNYGYYAEWNPSLGIIDNLDTAGASVAYGGPPGNQRLCETPVSAVNALGNYQWTFGVSNAVFGPLQQGNVDMVMTVTYYDDPSLAGGEITPGEYFTYNLGDNTPTGQLAPTTYQKPTLGTGTWTNMTWEIANISLYGDNGNQGGDPTLTFAATYPLLISAVQLNVIRPTGPFEGIDYLQTLGATTTPTNISLNWRGTAEVQATPILPGPWVDVTTVTNTLTNFYLPAISTTNKAEFFRLGIPGYPPYLGPAYTEGLIDNGAFLANAAAFTSSPGDIGTPNPAAIAGWTSSTASQGINGAGVNFSSSPSAPNGASQYTYAFIQNPGNLSQTLSLAPDTAYQLSFDAAAPPSGSGVTFQVQIGDNSSVYVSSGTTNTLNSGGFTEFTYTFTTPASFSGLPAIQLQNVSAAGSGLTVDFADVSLKQVSP